MASDVLLEEVIVKVASAFHFMPGPLDRGVVDDQLAAGPVTGMLIEAEAFHCLRRPGVPMQESVQPGLVAAVDGIGAVCPVSDGSEVNGVGIFNADGSGTRRIIDEDPGVKEGIFAYAVHASRSFPGDSLR